MDFRSTAAAWLQSLNNVVRPQLLWAAAFLLHCDVVSGSHSYSSAKPNLAVLLMRESKLKRETMNRDGVCFPSLIQEAKWLSWRGKEVSLQTPRWLCSFLFIGWWQWCVEGWGVNKVPHLLPLSKPCFKCCSCSHQARRHRPLYFIWPCVSTPSQSILASATPSLPSSHCSSHHSAQSLSVSKEKRRRRP